jgi:hypothetical protein
MMFNGFPEARCLHCNAEIGKGELRAIALVHGVPQYFCRFEGDNPQYSCYLQWRVLNARKLLQ